MIIYYLQVHTITLPIDNSMPESKLLGQLENYAKAANEIKRDHEGRITSIGCLKKPSNQLKNYGRVIESVSVNIHYCENTILTISDRLIDQNEALKVT